MGETYEAIPEEAKSDPYTYEEEMNDIDAHHWIKAMKSELDSMYSNQVWDLVKAPNEIKLIGCDGIAENYFISSSSIGIVHTQGTKLNQEVTQGDYETLLTC